MNVPEKIYTLNCDFSKILILNFKKIEGNLFLFYCEENDEEIPLFENEICLKNETPHEYAMWGYWVDFSDCVNFRRERINLKIESYKDEIKNLEELKNRYDDE